MRKLLLSFAALAAGVALPCTSLAAETELAPAERSVSVAQAEIPAPSAGIDQTYDPTSAFDGYWYPSTRALDGQEDR